ncbi:DUF7133 domain-containing protein [Adhaeribacter rhizoryzae]|uniref:Dehydrogenase n=1 Tax=Adhaeribacter rhizoryzae TaxID=2607907 RepID=A0A5M6D536_9BACT|nr:c-type cytochrome [Adhaeribacter rhizoryzae]KAA5542453.1 dehydrogenase [Adhaeribacter rhizoryzae]
MKKIYYPFLLLLLTGILFYCKSNKTLSGQAADTTPTANDKLTNAQVDLNASPFVSASDAIKMMQVEDGFEVKLVASEPLISTPVAITFDNNNRIWAVEMIGYMPDTVGTGEDIPNGKIVILEDKNKDGVADERKVFLDSLVLPRAICLIEDGILVAEPPRLWYYKIKNDKPVQKILVDEKYTEGGNVEHQPNGLLRAMDNWIYNAKSSKRYRKRGDKWEIERTHFRGQWGISQDNYGRLFYNTNSENLLGDYFAPGLGANNKNQRGVAGFNRKIVADNKVYPLRPTPGVNRGYMAGVLDESLRLTNFTAACGPLVYRGDLFGSAYAGNIFVAEPSANLIKRNIVSEAGYVINGQQAYQNREFISSLDERFRPVSLYNSPEGALYVVDMYRGIIQHETYLTTYLKKEIGKRQLTQPLSAGRIYKVVPKNKKTAAVTVPQNPEQLVKLLGHANGWVRDNAQQTLIDGKFTQAIPALRQIVKDKKNQLQAIHALWTLEGLGALQTDEVLALLNNPAWPLRMQALSALPSVLNKSNYAQVTSVLTQMLETDTLAAPYIAFITNNIQPLDKTAANNLLRQVVKKYPNNPYVADAVISNLQDQEETLGKELASLASGPDLAINKQMGRIVTSIRNTRANRNPDMLRKEFPKGAAMFNATCQTCHGPDGNGVNALGPPLNGSEYVTGRKDRLISVVLFGLTGPVTVKGHVYKAPEINGDMPGIGYNKDLPNEDIAELLSFIRKSWQNNADKVSAEDVTKVRTQLKGRQKAFTEAELNRM